MLKLFHTLRSELKAKLNENIVERNFDFPQISGKVDVATGMRRVGKSWFLLQVINKLLKQQNDFEQIFFINFEDDRLFPLDLKKTSRLVDLFYQEFPQNHHRICHLFFDEIQIVPQWPKLIRRLVDTKKVHIYLTGSSAHLLSKEIASNLRGRSLNTEIFPYNFSEYINSRKIQLDFASKGGAELDKTKKVLKDYLHQGGFPELTGIKPIHQIRILQDYVSVVLFRDVVERHNVKNISLAKYLLHTILKYSGENLSVNKLRKDISSQGIKISKNSIYNYLNYFEDAYLFFRVPLYSKSYRKVQTNPHKVYLIDTGLATAFNNEFSDNFGHYFENLIYLDLRRAGFDIYYYLTEDRKEIDFLALSPTGKMHLFQVCWDLFDHETLKKEKAALKQAAKELNITGQIITPDNYTNTFLPIINT